MANYKKMDDQDFIFVNESPSAKEDKEFSEYLKNIEKVLDFSRSNKSDQARDALMQYTAQAEKVNATFGSHMDYNVNLAKKVSDEATEEKK